MSVYIKGMEMPVDCLACRIACDKENYGVIGRPPKCPLAEAPVGDLISRADAIEAVCDDCEWEHKCHEDCTHIDTLKALPSSEAVDVTHDIPEYCSWSQTYTNMVQGAMSKESAEAVQGEWIEVEVFPEVYDIEGVKTWGSEMQCDQCGFRLTAIEGHMAQYNFCPNCGAKMSKGGDSE